MENHIEYLDTVKSYTYKYSNFYYHFAGDFVLPGDTFKSKEECLYFHRDITYKVSNVYQSKYGIVIFMYDKHGNERPYNSGCFESTTKTHRLMSKRQIETKLNFIWNLTGHTDDIIYHLRTGYNDYRYFKINNSSFFGSKPDAIVKIDEVNENGNILKTTYFNTVKEFYVFFNDLHDPKDSNFNYIKPIHVNVDYQLVIDNIKFITDNEFEVFKLPEEKNIGYSWQQLNNFNDMKFIEFYEFIFSLIFDNDYNTRNKEVFKDILYLFRDLPKQHGSTSISKILTGKSKIKNKNIDEYFNKYPEMKQVRLYELASKMESYLFSNNVMTNKEIVSDENLGQFSFIGSKYVNTEKLNDIISKINK